MKKVLLFLVLAASFLVSCTNDSSTDENAIDLSQIDEQHATGKDGGSSPGDKDGDGEE